MPIAVAYVDAIVILFWSTVPDGGLSHLLSYLSLHRRLTQNLGKLIDFSIHDLNRLYHLLDHHSSISLPPVFNHVLLLSLREAIQFFAFGISHGGLRHILEVFLLHGLSCKRKITKTNPKKGVSKFEIYDGCVAFWLFEKYVSLVKKPQNLFFNSLPLLLSLKWTQENVAIHNIYGDGFLNISYYGHRIIDWNISRFASLSIRILQAKVWFNCLIDSSISSSSTFATNFSEAVRQEDCIPCVIIVSSMIISLIC